MRADPNGFSEQKYTHIEDEAMKKKKAWCCEN
jgi:hypothetical protein